MTGTVDAAATPAAAPQPRSWLSRTAITLYNDRRVRYLAVGGVSAVSYYGFYAALYLLTRDHLHYLSPTIIANFLCGAVHLPPAAPLRLPVEGPGHRGLLQVLPDLPVGPGLHLPGLPLLVEVFNVPVLIAQAVLIVVAPMINYQLSKLWAFRH